MNKKNANFEKFCKQLIEHKILISKQRRATCPEIRVIWSYSFEYDEKVIRSFNKPSRNFEFCQPQCLKCVCAFLVEEFRFSGLAWLSFMKKNWNYPEILTLSQESMSACINLW